MSQGRGDVFVQLPHRATLTVAFVGIVLAVGLVVSAPAAAGTLANDANAMALWQGTVAFDGSVMDGMLGPYFHANVDYAVYAPGTFASSFPGEDPSAGADYVYAYQVFNIGTGTDSGIYKLTVGCDGLLSEGVSAIDYFGTGQMPDLMGLPGSPPTSAVWEYNVHPLPIGNPDPQTCVLLFTASAPPDWDSATLLGLLGSSDEELLPSPANVPEPGTLLLFCLAAAAIALRPTRQPST